MTSPRVLPMMLPTHARDCFDHWTDGLALPHPRKTWRWRDGRRLQGRDQSCELIHFHGRFHDSDCLAKAGGTRPAGFHSTIISLILVEVGSTRSRAVDQCDQAEALERSQRHRRSGRIHWRHRRWAESAANRSREAVRRGRQGIDKRVELKPKIDRRITFPLSIPAQTPALTYHAQRCLRMPLIMQ